MPELSLKHSRYSTFHFKECDIDRLRDEWTLYYLERTTTANAKTQRIDHYWRTIFDIRTADGQFKYRVLPLMVKMALVLPHSNADVERSLSVNNRTVTLDRSGLSNRTIIGLRAVKDYVKFCDRAAMRPEKLHITKNIQSCVRSASIVYKARLAEEERQKEERSCKQKEKAELDEKLKQEKLLIEENRKKLEQKEQELTESEKMMMQKLTVINSLLSDGN